MQSSFFAMKLSSVALADISNVKGVKKNQKSEVSSEALA